MKTPSSERCRAWRGGELTLGKVIKSSESGRQRRLLAPFLERSKLVLAEAALKFIYKKGCPCLRPRFDIPASFFPFRAPQST